MNFLEENDFAKENYQYTKSYKTEKYQLNNNSSSKLTTATKIVTQNRQR